MSKKFQKNGINDKNKSRILNTTIKERNNKNGKK